MKRSLRLTVLAGIVAVLGTGVAAQADGPGPDASQCVPPAGTPAPPGGTASGVILVIGSNTGGTASATFSCSYTFNSTSAPQYGAETPNSWTIAATHDYAATVDPVTGALTCAAGDSLSGSTCTHQDAAASGGDVNVNGPQALAPSQGTLTGTQPGDTITVTVTYGCVSQDPTGNACGGAGLVAVGSPS